MKKQSISDRLFADENIYLAIHLVHSYILNVELLCESDQALLRKLYDKFDTATISTVMRQVKERLHTIMQTEHEYFEATVFFKPKKIEHDKPVFRPLHTATLIDQIAMTAMLQLLVYDIDKNGKLILSEMSRIIPDDFYGNRISTDGKHLFKPWQEQYQSYSSQANTMLFSYSQTKEYRYEVNLDLVDFFPSVNPHILYSIMCDYIPVHYNAKDKETLKTIIGKLLIMKLHTLDLQEWKWYVGDSILYPQEMYVKGIPQGLPHSYFLANIVMVKIREIYQRHFHGNMLFYVDDSVIFTNGENHVITDLSFSQSISNINREIKQLFSLGIEIEQNLTPANYCYKESDFQIQVHNGDEKSTFYSIEEASSNSGELQLRGLSRESSKIGFDIFSSYTDEDINALHSRTKAICQNITKELEHAKQRKADISYQERLQRYLRFFDYREKVLCIRKEGNIERLLKKIVGDLQAITENTLSTFMQQYTEESLSSLIGYVHRTCLMHNINTQRLANAIDHVEGILYSNHVQHAYMSRSVSRNNSLEDINFYQTLEKIAQNAYRCYANLPFLKQYKVLKELFAMLHTKKEENSLFHELGFGDLFSWSRIVRANDDRLIKMLYNATVSAVLNYTIADSINIAKNGRDPITYAEIRLLSWLRSKKGSLDELHNQMEDMCAEPFCYPIDYSLLQVMDRFHTYVNQPNLIDNLILIHKYCCDTWRNGSKYLYFYTLHNQEHAITLIGNVVQIVHAISHLQLNRYDYFILFAACYLHDISMVSMPDFRVFYTGSDHDADDIYLRCKKHLNEDKLSDSEGKYQLHKTFREMEAFFEKRIRNAHAENSARDIRYYNELSFLDSATREVIALVSEAHCANSSEVYEEAIPPHGRLIHKKQISILLRLSDLLDMNSGRVSTVLLQHNMQDMNHISRFHWISHLVTKSCSLQTTYTSLVKAKRNSYIDKNSIKERITLTIEVALSQMTQVLNKTKCKNIQDCDFMQEIDDAGIEIIVGSDAKHCRNNSCCFLCKWFMLKNNYLLPELSMIQAYLHKLPDNVFAPEIKVIVRIAEDTLLPNDMFNYLREYVETEDT